MMFFNRYCATDMNTDLIEGGDESFRTSVNGRIPAERWGQAEDFKGPAVFLCSDASDYVHGASLVVSTAGFGTTVAGD
jgi:2-dehydro-3-deoxy-D-gluconate 5-dehydrogenase